MGVTLQKTRLGMTSTPAGTMYEGMGIRGGLVIITTIKKVKALIVTAIKGGS